MIGEHLSFEVLGHPEPAGSKRIGRHGPHPVILDANRKVDPWKRVVHSTAKGAMLKQRRPLIEGPVFVEMVFRRERPKSHLKKNGDLSLEGMRHDFPATKPDVLKLARGVEDACTGAVWKDDAQIVKEALRKVWGSPEGVTVMVVEL